MALTKRKKTNEMKKVRRHEDDTGSPESQIAILTREIDELATHLRKNRKDRDSRLGLLKKVEQRRRLIRYLQENDPERYNEIAEELELKKIDLNESEEEDTDEE